MAGRVFAWCRRLLFRIDHGFIAPLLGIREIEPPDEPLIQEPDAPGVAAGRFGAHDCLYLGRGRGRE